MLKKISLLIIAATLPCISLADKNTYIGIGPGLQFTRSYHGITGNIFAGYGSNGFQSPKSYLGAEVFANIGSLALSNNHSGRSNYSFGVDIIPGVYLNNNVLAYAKIGLQSSHFSSSNSNRVGTQLGIGVEFIEQINWALRLEYVYTGMGIIKNFNKSMSNQVNIALIYKFD